MSDTDDGKVASQSGFHSDSDAAAAAASMRMVPKGGRPKQVAKFKKAGKGLTRPKGHKHSTKAELQSSRTPMLLVSSPPPEGQGASPTSKNLMDRIRQFRRVGQRPPDLSAAAFFRTDTLVQPKYKQHDPIILGKSHSKNGWILQGSCPVDTLPGWFDKDDDDWRIDKHRRCLAVLDRWVGPPGDAPQDPRARHLFLQWHPLVDAALQRQYQDEGRDVYRCTFACMGACCASNGRYLVEQDGDSDEEEASECAVANLCRARLKVVVRARDIGQAEIWFKGEHAGTEGDGSMLRYSRLVRNKIREELQARRMSLTELKRFVIRIKETWAYAIPRARLPSDKKLENILKNFSARNALASDPLVALELVGQRHPGMIHFAAYKAGNKQRQQPSSPLVASMASEHSIDSIILHASRDGVGMDSSWRHKNENRAPLTFLTVVNEHQNMMPGAACISSDVKSSTLDIFLEEVTKRLIERAKGWINHPATMDAHGRPAAEIEQIKAESCAILLDGFDPRQFMIDKSTAELKSLRKRFPRAVIRLCQFHIVQAILRWVGDAEDFGREDWDRPLVPKGAHCAIIDAFRTLQRTRTPPQADGNPPTATQKEANFQQAQRHFFGDVRDILDSIRDSAWLEKHDIANTFAAIKTYFEKSWFCDMWRDTWIDDGLPLGETREGTGSTNNWIERAFRTFDDVFLNRRSNKRIDTLAVIILDQFFPYYEMFEGIERPNRALLECMDAGWAHWEVGMLEELSPWNGTRWQVDSASSGARYIVDLAIPRCTKEGDMCTRWQHTGKRCAHMWAATLQAGNGPHADWNAIDGQKHRTPVVQHPCMVKTKDSTIQNMATACERRQEVCDPEDNESTIAAASRPQDRCASSCSSSGEESDEVAKLQRDWRQAKLRNPELDPRQFLSTKAFLAQARVSLGPDLRHEHGDLGSASDRRSSIEGEEFDDDPGNGRGRPRSLTPLQPSRRSSSSSQLVMDRVAKRRALDASELRPSQAKGAGSKSQVFSRQPGPKRKKKALNSLFTSDEMQASPHRPPARAGPSITVTSPDSATFRPASKAQGYAQAALLEERAREAQEAQDQLEDAVIRGGADFRRWFADGYWVRIEEMEILTKALNQLICTFYEAWSGQAPIRPACFLPPINARHATDQSLPALLHIARRRQDWTTFSKNEISTFADQADATLDGPLPQFAFARYPDNQSNGCTPSMLLCPMLCANSHWVLVQTDSADLARRPIVWDPLRQHTVTADTTRGAYHVSVLTSLFADQDGLRPKSCPPCEPPASFKYESRPLGIQHDASTCGFWTGSLAISIGVRCRQPNWHTKKGRLTQLQLRHEAHLPSDAKYLPTLLVELVREYMDGRDTDQAPYGFISSTTLKQSIQGLLQEPDRSKVLKAWDLRFPLAVSEEHLAAPFYFTPVDWSWPTRWFDFPDPPAREMRTRIILGHAREHKKGDGTMALLINGEIISWDALRRFTLHGPSATLADAGYGHWTVETLIGLGIRRNNAEGQTEGYGKAILLHGIQVSDITKPEKPPGRWAHWRDQVLDEVEWIVWPAYVNKNHFIVLATRNSTQSLYVMDSRSAVTGQQWADLASAFLEWLDREGQARRALIAGGAARWAADLFKPASAPFSNFTRVRVPDYFQQSDFISCGVLAVEAAMACLDAKKGEDVGFLFTFSDPDLASIRQNHAENIINGWLPSDLWSTIENSQTGSPQWGHTFTYPAVRPHEDPFFLNAALTTRKTQETNSLDNERSHAAQPDASPELACKRPRDLESAEPASKRPRTEAQSPLAEEVALVKSPENDEEDGGTTLHEKSERQLRKRTNSTKATAKPASDQATPLPARSAATRQAAQKATGLAATGPVTRPNTRRAG